MDGARLGELARPLVTLAPSPPRLPNALKAGLTTLVCLSIPYLLGSFELGLLTVTGTFAVLYAPSAPLRRRAATVAGIGLGLVCATAIGAFTAGSPAAFAICGILLAMVSAGLCLALRVGPPGSYFIVLCGGIAYLLVGEHGTDPLLVPAMTAIGATVAWLVTMAEFVVDPRKPERKAVRAAAAAVTAYANSEPGPGSRPYHRAAAHALADAEEALVEGMWTPSEELSAKLAAAHAEFNARAARAAVHIVPGEDVAWDPHNLDAGRWITEEPGSPDIDLPSADAADRVSQALVDEEIRTIGSLRRRLADGLRWPGEPWSVALSVGVATAISIGILVMISGADQPHLYWVIAFSALVLHTGGPRSVRTYRALHRLTGTVVGLGLFLLVALAQPSGWALIVVIVVLQFAIELLVTRNYGLAVALISPLALLVASGGNIPEDPLPLVGERLLDTVIGVLVALAVLWGLGRRAHHRAVRGDTRRALDQLAAFARGEERTRGEPTLATSLRHLSTSNALLTADGYGDSPEARTGEAVVYAGYLMLGTLDRRTVAASATAWDELARSGLPAGWRRSGGMNDDNDDNDNDDNDDDVDLRIRQQCRRMGAALD